MVKSSLMKNNETYYWPRWGEKMDAEKGVILNESLFEG